MLACVVISRGSIDGQRYSQVVHVRCVLRAVPLTDQGAHLLVRHLFQLHIVKIKLTTE